MEPSGVGGLGVLPWLGGGLGICFSFALVLYNLIALIGLIREGGDEKPSVISMIAWAVAFVSFLLGPCGFVTAFLAFVLSRIEQNRIYAEKSPLRSTRPCEMATINSLLAMVSTAIFTLVAIASLL